MSTRPRTVSAAGTPRLRRWTGAALAAAVAIGIAGAPVPALAADATDYASFVNPFVGTESEGNAYPGATVPFGMVQLSPDNASSHQWTSYSHDAGRVWGFSHRHVNSAGCPAAGELLVSPTTTATPQMGRQFTDIAGDETAEAGYYGVSLTNGVRAELTATERVGVHRYTFPSTQTANISFNVGETLADSRSSGIEWVDDHTLEGWVENAGFCGSTNRSEFVYFSASFDRAPVATGLWTNDQNYTPNWQENHVGDGHNGAGATFDTTEDRTVEVHVGISFVSAEGARANRLAEVDDIGATFDTVRAAAKQSWNEVLGRADITSSDSAKYPFYTQLYKAMLSPTIGSDVDGRYRGMDGEVHTADGWTYHQTFSLWDTYRTQATLHGLLVPETASDIVRSMYQNRIEGGWLPRWSLGSLETNIMAGDPVSAWIAENFTLGTVPEDIADELWAALVENATTAPPSGVASVGRQSAEFYLENGHIPYHSENDPGLGQQFEEYRHGGSATMEFAQADAAIGAAAQRLGKDDVAQEFLERGQNWRNLWNDDVELSGGFHGIVNAVTENGEFVPVDEYESVQESGFHEGTQWQYQWMANQDYAGLRQVMSGTEAFLDRLDYYFDLPALLAHPGESPEHWASGGSDYYSSIGYNPGNEPTLMNPWLYSAAGEPAHVNDVLAANLNRFPNTAGGGVGNDDLGTLASWYVMATLGVQPVASGSGMLALNSPRVQAATLRLGQDGPVLQITADGAHETLPSYIAGVTIDGEQHSETWMDVEDFQDGGTIDFALTDDAASTDWGTAEADWLPSVADPQRLEPALEPAEDISFVAGERSAQAVATVEIPGTSETVARTAAGDDPPLSASIDIDGETHELGVIGDGATWSLVLDTSFPQAAEITGLVTIRSARDTPRFAPDLFSAQSSEVLVTIREAGSTNPSDPDPSDPDGPGSGGSGTDGPEPGRDGGDAASDGSLAATGGEPLAAALIAALLMLAAGAGVLLRRRNA